MNNRFDVDTCIVGAGVIGLAIARLLALKGLDVLVLEAGPRMGEGISSRNSEVIHAGIYYPKDSLKAELCVRGKWLLYEYCQKMGVAHQQLGKFIVATSVEEEDQLEGIRQRAADNGVPDLAYVTQAELRQAEPALGVTAALLSPSTGIVSSHGLMLALLGEIEASGGALALNTRVRAIEPAQAGFTVQCDIQGDDYTFSCRQLVNAAGLGAQSVARCLMAMKADLVPPLYLCKGNYFLYQGQSPFSRLIYPVPDPSGAGLGVHATIDLGGQVRFGPDVEYVQEETYDVSNEQLAAGIDAIRRYFPSLDETRLTPGYAGIRPKLQAPGQPAMDFVIQGPETHGFSGLVHLFGIESPGLTSSMAIAETVASRLDVPGFQS